MTTNKAQKNAIRQRMTKTGERYTAARHYLLGNDQQHPEPDQPIESSGPVEPVMPESSSGLDAVIVEQPGMSDEAIQRGSGKTWGEWLMILDAWGAAERPHKEIASYVQAEFGVDGWYAQSVTVGYERMRGMRARGQQGDGLYSGSASKTFPVPVSTLFEAWTVEATRDRWLEPGTLRIRTSSSEKSARFDVVGEDAILVAWFADKGAGKSSVQLQCEKLPSKANADDFRAIWKERLATLAGMLAQG